MHNSFLRFRGGFRRGGFFFRDSTPCGRCFLRDSTPCRPKGSPLCTNLGYPFLVTDTEIFLKAPIYTNFEGGSARQKFFGQNFQKVPKTPFRPVFCKILPAAQKFWPKQSLCNALRELGKSIWSTKFSKFF